MSTPNINRLLARAGKNNELTKCEADLDGEDYSYWIKPMTMAQIVEARKGLKGATLTDTEASVKLYVLRALNENGTRQYTNGDYDVLMRLPVDDLLKLTGAMNKAEDDEEEQSYDMKSPDEGTKEKAGRAVGNGDSRKAASNAD